jgi:ribose 5-phosphate isomerase A
MNNSANSNRLTAIAEKAATMVHDGFVVGLGSGRAATKFVETLGERVRQGLRIRGVPTSQSTAELARQYGIPLATPDEIETIDIAVDGADEFDPQLDLIKGWGGALVREKIVAAASRQFVIVVGSEKRVKKLGERGKLPVEVVPFAMGLCRRRISRIGFVSHPRMTGSNLFVTDNGNYILDCVVPAIENPAELELQLRSIPGVVGTGLFLGMADVVLVQDGEDVTVLGEGG